jgi:high-affinity nickel permease
MDRLDGFVAGSLGHGSVWLTVLVAILLGLRHATDPDHLVAVTTLIAGEESSRSRRAVRLALAWGLGHGLALLVLGGAVVVFGAHLPPVAVTAAEALVGLIVIALALRLLVRVRRGSLVEHRHGLPLHAHPVRGRWQAFAVGVAHGTGGSAGISVLLLARISDQGLALAALLLFAAGTALSMALASVCFARGLGGSPRRQERLLPVMGFGGGAFGVFYLVSALA